MKRIVLAAVVGLLAAVPAAVMGGGAATGAKGGCARRIVSLAPHATQDLFAFGAGGDVVGVDDFSREPPAARRLPRLGSYIDPDLEGIVGLQPDLVVLTPWQAELAEKLARLGVRSALVPDRRMADVYATIADLGRATCRDGDAAALAQRVRDDVAAAAAGAGSGAPLRAVLVVDRPAGELRQFFVAGPGNFLDDVLREAGARNVFADAPNSFPQVSLEPLVAADPDLVIELLPGADAVAAAQRVADWSRTAPTLRAVRRGAVFAVTEPWLPDPGPTVSRAVALVAGLVAQARAARERTP